MDTHIIKSHQLLQELKKQKPLKHVVVESRFAGNSIEAMLINKKFTLACMRDCIKKGEAPYASHVIYAHSYIVDDFIPEERALGIHAGFQWGNFAEKTVVYTDLGISSGMQEGINHSYQMNRPIEYRELGFIPQVTQEEIAMEEAYIKNQLAFLEVIKANDPSIIVSEPLIKNVA